MTEIQKSITAANNRTKLAYTTNITPTTVANVSTTAANSASTPVDKTTQENTIQKSKVEKPSVWEEKTAYVKGFATGFKDYFAEKLEGTGSDLATLATAPMNIMTFSLFSEKSPTDTLMEPINAAGDLMSKSASILFPYFNKESDNVKNATPNANPMNVDPMDISPDEVASLTPSDMPYIE